MKQEESGALIENGKELDLDGLVKFVNDQEEELFQAVGEGDRSLVDVVDELNAAQAELEALEDSKENAAVIAKKQQEVQDLATEALGIAYGGRALATAMAVNLESICNLLKEEHDLELVDDVEKEAGAEDDEG